MTDQQETTTVSVSEYESAGSLSNGLVKNVKIAPRSVERFEKTADSLSLNSVSFKVPISDNLLLSRRMILEMPVTLRVDAGAEHIRHFYAFHSFICFLSSSDKSILFYLSQEKYIFK